MAAPLCRYCGKPIPKRTKMICFGSSPSQGAIIYRAEKPASREEAQRLVNEEIVSIRYATDRDGFRYLSQISIWDGESYSDPFFCKTPHALEFAYAAARMERFVAMPAYFNALEAQKEKERG